MKKCVKFFLLALSLATICGSAKAQTLTETLEKLGAKPCEDSSLVCVTLKTPKNHFGNDPSDSLPITFAISPASEPSEGIVFYAIGGPGGKLQGRL
jgi:hypothetical protein